MGGYLCLVSELPLSTDFAGHPSNLGREQGDLVVHAGKDGGISSIGR